MSIVITLRFRYYFYSDISLQNKHNTINIIILFTSFYILLKQDKWRQLIDTICNICKIVWDIGFPWFCDFLNKQSQCLKTECLTFIFSSRNIQMLFILCQQYKAFTIKHTVEVLTFNTGEKVWFCIISFTTEHHQLSL